MRAFVALDLPDEVIQPLTRLQAGLTVGRLTPEENLHLTLAFLGEVADGIAHDLAEALAGMRLGPVTLDLAGLDLFGGRRPTVLFVAARGEGLQTIHDKVMRAAREAGAVLPRERFRPHVTLARFAANLGDKDQRRLGDFLSLNGAFALPPAPAHVITLYRSHLRDDGAFHEPLASFPLDA